MNLVLVKEVKSNDEIKSLSDKFAILNIYELSQNDDRERIFEKHSKEQRNWYDKLLGSGTLENCYYVYPGCVSLVFEVDIHHQDAQGPIALTLKLSVGIDMENSDSGKGLADWLVEHGGGMDKESLKSYVQEAFVPGFLEHGLGLRSKSWSELNGGGLQFGPESFSQILPHWISVDCQVIEAVEKMTQSQIDRKNEARKKAEIANRQAEIERCHQEKLDQKRRLQEEIQADIEVETLKRELITLKDEPSDKEKQRLAALLETVRDMLRSEKTDGLLQIKGTPWPTERIKLELNGVQLELYAMKKATLGRATPNSDVSVKIPQGCPDDEKRRKQEQKPTLSRIHTMLEWRGDAIHVENKSNYCMTYVNEKEVPITGMNFKGDVELGFSWDVRWQAHVHSCTGHLRLPCCDGCAARGVSSMVLAYPGWTQQYKVFVWQCNVLRLVDSRLPDWRVVYQYGAQGSEGAFYLLTSRGQCVYLQPDNDIEEDGIVMSVKAM